MAILYTKTVDVGPACSVIRVQFVERQCTEQWNRWYSHVHFFLCWMLAARLRHGLPPRWSNSNSKLLLHHAWHKKLQCNWPTKLNRIIITARELEGTHRVWTHVTLLLSVRVLTPPSECRWSAVVSIYEAVDDWFRHLVNVDETRL